MVRYCGNYYTYVGVVTHSIRTVYTQVMHSLCARVLEYFRKINKNQNISWGWPVQTTKVAILDLGPYPAYQKKQPLYRSLCISIYTMNKFINNLLTTKFHIAWVFLFLLSAMAVCVYALASLL